MRQRAQSPAKVARMHPQDGPRTTKLCRIQVWEQSSVSQFQTTADTADARETQNLVAYRSGTKGNSLFVIHKGNEESGGNHRSVKQQLFLKNIQETPPLKKNSSGFFVIDIADLCSI